MLPCCPRAAGVGHRPLLPAAVSSSLSGTNSCKVGVVSLTNSPPQIRGSNQQFARNHVAKRRPPRGSWSYCVQMRFPRAAREGTGVTPKTVQGVAPGVGHMRVVGGIVASNVGFLVLVPPRPPTWPDVRASQRRCFSTRRGHRPTSSQGRPRRSLCMGPSDINLLLLLPAVALPESAHSLSGNSPHRVLGCVQPLTGSWGSFWHWSGILSQSAGVPRFRPA